MDPVAVSVAGVLGLFAGSVVNTFVVREPAYTITDPADLPEGADPALLLELEPPPDDLAPVPVLALVRPRTWWRWWFPATELVTAGTAVAAVARFGLTPVGVVVTGMAMALLCLAAVDLRVYRIPDRINFPTTALGFASIVAASLLEAEPVAILGAAVGGVLFASMLFVAHVISPRGMGWGDVKLAWPMGLLLGWQGPAVDWAAADGWVDLVLGPLRSVILGLAAGSVLGVVIGGAYAVVRRSARAVFPYGPALVAGCLLALLAGDHVVS